MPVLQVYGTNDNKRKNAIGHQLPEPGELSAEQTEGLFYRYKTEMRIHRSSEFRAFHQWLKVLKL